MQTTEAGTGELRAASGEILLPEARYELTIRHAPILGGLPDIDGAIVNGPPHGFPGAMVGAHAVLRLEDGREWECVLADGSGRLRPRGEDVRPRPFEKE